MRFAHTGEVAGIAGQTVAGLAHGIIKGTILVGAAMVATRFVIDQTTPASLAFLRYLIGTCCLLPAFLASGTVRFERRDLLPIAVLGITQFGILIALLNYALQFIPAARAALRARPSIRVRAPSGSASRGCVP